jgi:CheY-like chemotaxis protein
MSARIPREARYNPSAASDRSMSEKKTVLLIDDDADILTLLKHGLEKQGRNVVVTRHPSMVLRLVKETKPDLIVCDIRMDERSGDQVALDLAGHASANRIPFVFLSSTVRPDEIQADGTVNGIWMMSKATPKELILARIAELLGA